MMSVKYEATVVTGFEKVAAEECKEKFGALDIQAEQGRIGFYTDGNVGDVLAMRGVDNISVVAANCEFPELPSDKDQLKKMLEEFSEEANWKAALEVWCKAYNSELDLQKVLTAEPIEGFAKPAFRVTCRRVGDDHCFSSVEAASIFGAVINDKYHWPVSMEKFDFEVLLNIRDRNVTIGLALTTQSLHYRNLVSFGPTSLRATICHNMLRLAEIKPGDIVFDPMCGSAAIPLESSISWPKCFNLASDNHPKAIEHASTNITASALGPTDLLQANVTTLPFRDASVDVFITDLPFGKRMGSKQNNRTLYMGAITELGRCARLSTGRAVLLTQDKKNMNAALANDVAKRYWRRTKMHFVKVGGLAAAVYYLSRTPNMFRL